VDTDGWHRVDPSDVPGDGRVRSVTVDGRTLALARCGTRLGALENRCPHQGGPLGEGSIENGWLRHAAGRGTRPADLYRDPA
jgi:nitrite reductase/ring-hydroxylating ferredoxin subunit